MDTDLFLVETLRLNLHNVDIILLGIRHQNCRLDEQPERVLSSSQINLKDTHYSLVYWLAFVLIIPLLLHRVLGVVREAKRAITDDNHQKQ